MKPAIRTIALEKVKSKWYTDIFKEWHPDRQYIEFLVKNVKEKKYTPPVIVVEESGVYYLVNGHHRYYAHLEAGEKNIKCIVISCTFAESEPLRKAEVLLKEFDQKTEYRYQLSGYLDRWAAEAEAHHFINKYRPTIKLRLYKWLKRLLGNRGNAGS